MTTVCQWLTEKMPQLFVIFDKAKETRAQLPIHKEGAIPAMICLLMYQINQESLLKLRKF